MPKNAKNMLEIDTRYAIKIIRADNGWILERWEEISDNEFRKVEQVFEDKCEKEDENGSEEKLSLIEALQEAVEYFGQGGSKHDKRRISIKYTDKW